MRFRAAIALGSNLGDRLGHLRMAHERLAGLGAIEAVSSLYETAPVGGPTQDDYLNAVVVLATSLAPDRLLEEAHEIERLAERQRVERWGPRTLDVDLITVTDEGEVVSSDDPHLTLPHPRATQRRFVLEPLAEVWPEAPVGGLTANDALPAVADQPCDKLGERWTVAPSLLPWLLVVIQGIVLLAAVAVALGTGDIGAASPIEWMLAAVAAAAGLTLVAVSVALLGVRVSPLPVPGPDMVLVERGPYGWMRHPIYAGLVLLAVALALLAGSAWSWLAAAGVAVFFWIKGRYEESQMIVAVPGYRRYLRQVRGRLIPWPFGAI